MQTTLNTNLLPIINVGMYDSELSAENIFDDDMLNQELNDGYIFYNSEFFWDNFDNKKYVKFIEGCVKGFIISNNNFKYVPCINSIEAGEIYSPKYYNYSTDNIDLIVDYNKGKVLSYVKEYKGYFETFLKNNYSSYDGFISFTSNNYKDWLEDFKNNEEQAIGAALCYIFAENEDISEMNDFFVDYVYNYTPCFWDFLTDESIAIIKKVQNIVNNSFNTLYVQGMTVIEMVGVIDISEYGKDYFNIKPYITKKMNEVANNTLTIF